MKLALALMLVLSLGGCVSVKEANARQAAAQRAEDQTTCLGYGYKKDTPEFSNCLMLIDQQRKGYDAASYSAGSQAALAASQAMLQSATPHVTTCNRTFTGVQCY